MIKNIWNSLLDLIGKRKNSEMVAKEEVVNSGGQNISKRQKYDLDRRIIIVDVGCRWGFAERYLDRIDDFTIYGFDPDVEECRKLNEKYNSQYISAVPVALAEVPGERVLYLTKEPACSSLLKPDAYLTSNYPALECATEIGRTRVFTTTLDAWADSTGLEEIDHLKVDTQGSELEILKGAKSILKTVRSIEVEVEFNPIYEGQPVFSDIDRYLRSEGFVLWKLTNTVHYSRRKISTHPIGRDLICYDSFHAINVDLHAGQIYWANAHYVRADIVRDFHLLPSIQRDRDRALFDALGMPDVTEP